MGGTTTRRRRGALGVGLAGLLMSIAATPAAAVVAPLPPDVPAPETVPTPPSTAPQAPVEPATPAATPAEAAVVPTAPTPTVPVTQAVSAWTTLRLSPQDALNAHTADLSADQLLAALGQPGAFTVDFAVTAGLVDPENELLDSAWITCGHRSWCAPGQSVTVAGLATRTGDAQWGDYTGGVWDSTDPAGPGRDPAVPAPANALHVLTSDVPGATRWLAQVWPVLTELDRAPRASQRLTLHYRTAADGAEHEVPVRLGSYPISVPVVNEVSSGSIAGDTLTTQGGQLALTLWRPQRIGATAGEPVADLAGLHYGLVLSDGSSTISCGPQRYSGFTGLAVDPQLAWTGPTGGQGLPLLDGAPVDLDPAQSAPIGFTLDVAGCLSDAAAAGVTLGSGLSATLLSAGSPLATRSTDVVTSPPASSAGVTYRLVAGQ